MMDLVFREKGGASAEDGAMKVQGWGYGGGKGRDTVIVSKLSQSHR